MLSREMAVGDEIVIAGVRITVLAIAGEVATLGLDAPPGIRVRPAEAEPQRWDDALNQ
jgi:sRNA-binding carbon storage regulator CsrA